MYEHDIMWDHLNFPEKNKSNNYNNKKNNNIKYRWISCKTGLKQIVTAFISLSTLLLLICFTTITIHCSCNQSYICEHSKDLYPTMLNALSGFLLVFYIQQTYTRYLRMQYACSNLQNATIGIILISTSTLKYKQDKQDNKRYLLEVWRLVNLIHITSYIGIKQDNNNYNS